MWRTTRARGRTVAGHLLLGRLCILAGVVLMTLPLGSYVYASWQQQIILQTTDDLRIVESPALTVTETVPLSGSARAVSPANTPVHQQTRLPLMRLEIPTLRLHLAVMTDITLERLAKGPGHYPGSPLPSDGGNTAIAGHRTVRGMPSFFYRLDRLGPGDEIRLTSGGQGFLYRVESVFVVDPHDVWVLEPTDETVLTLTTCDPPGTTDKRLIVRAILVSPDKR